MKAITSFLLGIMLTLSVWGVAKADTVQPMTWFPGADFTMPGPDPAVMMPEPPSQAVVDTMNMPAPCDVRMGPDCAFVGDAAHPMPEWLANFNN